MARLGHGASQGRMSERSPGEVCALPESPHGQKPAEPGVTTSAGDHPAPGIHHATHAEDGKDRDGSAPMSKSERSLRAEWRYSDSW